MPSCSYCNAGSEPTSSTTSCQGCLGVSQHNILRTDPIREHSPTQEIPIVLHVYQVRLQDRMHRPAPHVNLDKSPHPIELDAKIVLRYVLVLNETESRVLLPKVVRLHVHPVPETDTLYLGIQLVKLVNL